MVFSAYHLEVIWVSLFFFDSLGTSNQILVSFVFSFLVACCGAKGRDLSLILKKKKLSWDLTLNSILSSF